MIDKFPKILTYIFNFLTWKKILIIFISLISLFFFIYFYFFSVNELPIKSNILFISQNVKNEIKKADDISDNILGIQIVTLDFSRNKRYETYISSNDSLINELYQIYKESPSYNIPIFDYDDVSNKRTMRVLSGEFFCVPYKKTLAYKYAPGGEAVISEVCSLPIPPGGGESRGILTIYLKQTPTDAEFEELLNWCRKISSKIYFENVSY